MAFAGTPRDAANLPLSCTYVPNSGITAMQGAFSTTDASSNVSSAAVVTPVDGFRATYSAAASAIVPATTAGTIFTLRGSSTLATRLTRCHISGIATTAVTLDITLAKWSAAPSGGTAITAPTMVPHDSNNAAASALVAGYSAAPTAGTLVGILRSAKLFLPLTTTVSGPYIEWEFGERPAQCPVLRGVAQYYAIIINALPAGGSLDVSIEWTEDGS